MRGRRYAGIAFIAALLASVAACGSRPPDRAPAGPATAADTVQTPAGPVQGRVNGAGAVFLGIPYAAPPVGRLRWQPPQPVARWTQPLPASHLGHPCPQPRVSGTAEDCLYLNVYAPVRSAAKLPVILWIHGGSFSSGQAGDVDGTDLAIRGHVVVVSLNYRLGPLGFLDLASMTTAQNGASPGDFGLLDQQAGMRWVRDSIAAFGGDPAHVTIMGQSAGAASVCAHLSSPGAAGLFARAIAESGCTQGFRARPLAQAQGAELAAAAGCPNPGDQLACLRAVPADRLIATAAARTDLSWQPATGTPTLPTTTVSALQTGKFAQVPILIGTNHNEGGIFVTPSYDSSTSRLSANRYVSALSTQFGAPAASAVAATYPLSTYGSPGAALAAAVGDGRFSCPALNAADLLSRSVPTFAYEFDDEQAPQRFSFTPAFPLGAYHTAEIQYVFPRSGSLLTGAHAGLSARMVGYWTRFAATGNPDPPGQTTWPKYVSGSGVFTRLSPTSRQPVSDFPTEHRCGFWARPSR